MVISDPHIKVDPDYSVYAKAKEQGFFVKNPEGGDFEGICWPGMVSLASTCAVPVNKNVYGQNSRSSWACLSLPATFSAPLREIGHCLL